jgi:hypothetical protein
MQVIYLQTLLHPQTFENIISNDDVCTSIRMLHLQKNSANLAKITHLDQNNKIFQT